MSFKKTRSLYQTPVIDILQPNGDNGSLSKGKNKRKTPAELLHYGTLSGITHFLTGKSYRKTG